VFRVAVKHSSFAGSGEQPPPLFVDHSLGSIKANRSAVSLVVALALSLLAACTTPVGVERLDPQDVHRQLTGNVLSTGALSQFTENVLRQHALDVVAEADAAAALAKLHAAAVTDPQPDALFALTELSFHHAEDGGGSPYFLAAAAYAVAFLFPKDPSARPGPLEPRTRWAADIYNRALTEAFVSADSLRFEPRAGQFQLPFGALDVAFDEAELIWGDRRLTEFVPVAELGIRGLRNRYRQAGLGAPLAASTVPLQPHAGFQIGPRVKVPVTALLHFEDAGRQLADGRLNARLDLYTATDPDLVSIAGQSIPIEAEPSAALAYTLSDPAAWAAEYRGFFRAEALGDLPSQLGAIEPYQPGRFPVVFVHGTASSAGRWADMVNDLQNDPSIRDRFQFWFFVYGTGNPIPYSALVLRDSLREAVEDLDPAGADAALREMVVIGHSQGGLLTKMTAIDSGSGLYDAFSSKPLDQLRLRPESRELLERALFIEPLPFVRRVVFIATPHGGSYLAEYSVGRMIAGFVTLPLKIAGATAEFITADPTALRVNPKGVRIGSVYGMTPGSPLITSLAQVPLAPGVAAHSIIAVEGDGPPEEGGDGVVRYESAHIEGVESEFIVRSAHSTQANPHTIAEVRRILLLHADEACAKRGVGCGE
jgi:pimeloyl-ACP methyl ester carboxylesterase